jgi:hypothetical protein
MKQIPALSPSRRQPETFPVVILTQSEVEGEGPLYLPLSFEQMTRGTAMSVASTN